MEHSCYNLTFLLSKVGGNEIDIMEGLNEAVEKMPHQALELTEFECEYYRDGHWIVEAEILTKDYGISEIGVDLISKWCGKVFHYDLPFKINEILIDKSLFTFKTLIKYDEQTNQVVVVRLSDGS